MKTKFISHNWVEDICGIMLIVMWCYAAFSKLFSFEEFRFGLLNHDLLKNNTVFFAWAVPICELIIVLMLLIDKYKRVGFTLSAILLGIFTGYIFYMFYFYPHQPCSCGGIISKLSWKQHIVFNLVFLGMALLGRTKKYVHQKNIHAA